MAVSFDPAQLIRPNIVDLDPYTPILPFEILSEQLGRRPDDIIKLDANENPYGPSPLVAEALAEAPYLHIYPDPESRELRKALADYTGVEVDYLMVGSGADELIDLILRLLIEAGDVVINCPPTFGMYAFDGQINGAQVINVWRQSDFSVDIEALEDYFKDAAQTGKLDGVKRPKVIFVTSPNNPDGSILSDDDLERLLELPAVVVLDEAYIEFSGGSRMQWVKRHLNLVVLRTFSKWAGLAGLRVGYGAFPPGLINHLWKIKQPYNVNLAGQIAARVSLTDQERLLGNVARIIAERDRFLTTLKQFDWLTPYASQTNFILCRVDGRPALEVKHQLAQHGIFVRYYRSTGLTDHIRISIGTPAQMARLEEALKTL